MKGTNRRLNPCFWMRVLLNGMAEGHTTGILGWYAKKHVDGCPKCREALEALKAVRFRLSSLKSPESSVSDSVWEKVEATAVE